MATATPRSVTIAVLTYQRPEDIATALPRLVTQCERYPGTATILVIDNDPDASAKGLVTAADGPIRYVHEPTPGIAAARNRALAEAETDLLAFIDDDETPSERWLELLVAEHDRIPGTFGVAGRVVSTFDAEPDPWITAGRFFERLDHPTGTEVPVVATNNLLLDLDLVRRWNLSFDPAFGLTGGSDTVFSHRATAAGGTFRWCSEAVVDDRVPAERATRDWVLKRAYRMGNSWSLAKLATTESPPARLAARIMLSGQGLIRIAGGAARWTVGRVTGSIAQQARGTRTVYRGRGMLGGAIGHTYAEYRRS